MLFWLWYPFGWLETVIREQGAGSRELIRSQLKADRFLAVTSD
ncbi:hypothetical protein [Chroococcidiopsis sp.]